MATVDCRRERDWLRACAHAVKEEGYCLVEGVLPARDIESARAAMYRAQQRIVAEVGAARLERAGELGVLRLMMKLRARSSSFSRVARDARGDRSAAFADRDHAPSERLHPASSPPAISRASFQNSSTRTFRGC